MARTPQTPEEKKRAGVLLLIFAALLILVGAGGQINRINIKRQCNASVSGVITEVKSKQVRTKKRYGSRTHTEYQAYISIEGNSPLGNEVVSGWTRTHYQVESVITVYYDPTDPSVYYAEGAEPESGFALIILSLFFLAGGVWYIKTGTDERKRIWESTPPA